MILHRLQRIGVIVVLVLAALLLGADSGEYPGWSRAGIVALGRGVVPLLVVAGLNFAAFGGGRTVRVLALATNLVFLGVALRMVRIGAPPFVWMATGAAVLLVVASGGRVLRADAAPPPSADS
jgi:hypothetical protein